MLHIHMRRLALLILLLSSALLQPGTTRAHARPAPAQARLSALPLGFVPNRGQTDSSVRFVARGLGGTIFFTAREVVLSLANGRSQSPAVLRLRWDGASAAPSIRGVDRQVGVVSYLTGADATRWQTALPTYAGIRYRQLYPGIDLRYDGLDGQLKSTYLVAAGADASRIRWQYDGASRVELADDGSLRISLAQGDTLREAAPLAWQDIAGQRRYVAVRYRVERSGGLGFDLGSYDRTQPLVIDPTLSYSTFLGGSGNDFGYSIAIDSAGNAYVAGETASLNFPTASALQPAKAGGIDAFVAKVNASGSALTYSTYLGGTATDRAYGIAVDGSGNAYLVGSTGSTDFPTVSPIQSSNAGLTDAFVAKLNASGSALTYSTYLGGGNDDYGYGITVDGDGNAYITGETTSIDWPTASPFQGSFGGGSNDGIVAKLNASGSALTYSTYLGGNDFDQGLGIAVNSAGQAVVGGKTAATNFPTASAIQPTIGGGIDAFVTRFNASGSALSFSTYLGGSGSDSANGVALDGSDNVYLTGSTSSANFPTVNPIQASYAGGNDALAAKISAAGTTLVYSTYLGGSSADAGLSIAVGDDGSAHLTGYSRSTNYPTVNPIQATRAGSDDVIVSSLNASGSALSFSTYLGGTSQDWGYGIRVDSAGARYITGYTFSSGFPTASPLQPTRAGVADAIVARITP